MHTIKRSAKTTCKLFLQPKKIALILALSLLSDTAAAAARDWNGNTSDVWGVGGN